MVTFLKRMFSRRSANENSARLSVPAPALPVKIARGYLISITSIHLLSLLAFNS
jgi:hypothetical protein